MDPAILMGTAGGLTIALLLLAGAAWLGSRLGQALERASASRDLRSVDAFNRVSQSLAGLAGRTVDESLGLVLKNAAAGLGARAGCVLLTAGAARPLRLVYSLGVADFAGLLAAANDPHFLGQLKSVPHNAIAADGSTYPAWAPLLGRGGRAFAATLFGRERGWYGLLALAWATPDEAAELTPALLNIGHYSGQVLAELESREQRARDFLSLQTQLDALEGRLREIDAVLHDAQNPLAQIPALLFLLEESDGRRLPSQAAAEIESLVMLTAGILQTEISLRQLDPEAVPIPQLVELVPSLMSGTFTNRLGTLNLRFEMDLAPGLPPVCGERVSLIRVLNNLLNNAAKYNRQDGAIRLSVRRSGDFVLFDVENTGPAIPPEVLPRLFEFGFRVVGSDRLAGGQGIGLYSCQKIIDLHGGRIWAECRDGINHFIFSVPVAGDPRPAAYAHEGSLPAG